MEQKGFKFKLNLGNKTSGLAYINYQTKGVLSWLIKPLINKKIASYQDAKSLRYGSIFSMYRRIERSWVKK
jgi:hypothetical protein